QQAQNPPHLRRPDRQRYFTRRPGTRACSTRATDRVTDRTRDRGEHHCGTDRPPQPGHDAGVVACPHPAGDCSGMIFAVVPAAGHSPRMGRPKLALPLAGRTVIELLVEALRSGGCAHVLAVVGPHVPELLAPAARAGAHVCLLDEPTPD